MIVSLAGSEGGREDLGQMNKGVNKGKPKKERKDRQKVSHSNIVAKGPFLTGNCFCPKLRTIPYLVDYFCAL